MQPVLRVVGKASTTSRAFKCATVGLGDLTHSEVNAQLGGRIEWLSAMRARMHIGIGNRASVVPQCVALIDNLALARSPLRAAEIAELRAAMTRDVVAASLLLNNMATLEATHPIHLPTELGDIIYNLRGKVLILWTGHSFMPFRSAFEANRLLTSRASNRTGAQNIVASGLSGDVHLCVPAMPHYSHVLMRDQGVQNDKHATTHIRTIHSKGCPVKHHRLLVLLS